MFIVTQNIKNVAILKKVHNNIVTNLNKPV